MALYIPPAVNMLIPRGTFGGAGQQPRIKPTIIILHTNASNTSLAGAASLMKYTTKGQEYHCQQEAPGTGRIAGRIGQYVDFEIRADNNYKANSFYSGGVLCGAISVETADHGTPYELSWTDLGQRRNLEDMLVWLCKTLGIPARRCPDPYSPGIGYHSMWGYNTSSNPNVNPWTNAYGKICPGPGKIREFPGLLAAVAARVAGGPPPPPPPTPSGDSEMAMLIASSDGDATRKATVFSYSGAMITQFPVDMDVISLADVANVLTINPADPQRAFRRPASEIQALITLGWGGPRGATAGSLGGYVIPADPAAVVAVAAKASADAATTKAAEAAMLGRSASDLAAQARDAANNAATHAEAAEAAAKEAKEAAESIPGGVSDVAAIAKAVNDEAHRRSES